MIATIQFGLFCLSRLLSKNLKIKIHKTIIFLLRCMGVKLGLAHKGITWVEHV